MSSVQGGSGQFRAKDKSDHRMKSWLVLLVFVSLIATSIGSSLERVTRDLNDNDLFDDDDGDNGDDSILSDDFFDFGQEEDPFAEFAEGSEADQVSLRPCFNLTEAEIEAGVKCDPDAQPPEPRYPDQLLQQLITQVWSDFQAKLRTGSLRGRQIDPLDIDELLSEPISLKQAGSLYTANVNMSGIKLYGISDIVLDHASVTRDANLTDLVADIRFAFDELLINGTYSMIGRMAWIDVDSQGVQPFLISMKNATFSVKVEMDTLSGMCGPDGNVLVTNIGLPLAYDDIDFRFTNLGDFANNVVNGVGIYFLQTQETFLVGAVKNSIRDKVNSLIC